MRERDLNYIAIKVNNANILVMRIGLVILIIVLIGTLNCQEVSIGAEGIDLITSEAWGRPKEVLKVEQYELWYR